MRVGVNGGAPLEAQALTPTCVLADAEKRSWVNTKMKRVASQRETSPLIDRAGIFCFIGQFDDNTASLRNNEARGSGKD